MIRNLLETITHLGKMISLSLSVLTWAYVHVVLLRVNSTAHVALVLLLGSKITKGMDIYWILYLLFTG